MSTPRGWSGGWASSGWPSGWSSGQTMRIGDLERESAARALGEHFAAGRLTKEEFDERADRAWKARTGAELRPLFADLPAPHPGTRMTSAPSGASAPSRPAGRRFPVVPVFLLALGLVLLTHAPGAVILLLLGVWWLTASMRLRRHRAHWAARYQHWGGARPF